MTSAHAVQTQASRVPFYLSVLVAFHIALVIASNYLVQLPITLLGFHSTWGAFSFPFIFLATDLTVRLIGKTAARRVIMRAMLPALVVSYVVGVLFHEGRFNGWEALQSFNGFVFRIALASFAAYVLASCWTFRSSTASARKAIPGGWLRRLRRCSARCWTPQPFSRSPSGIAPMPSWRPTGWKSPWSTMSSSWG